LVRQLNGLLLAITPHSSKPYEPAKSEGESAFDDLFLVDSEKEVAPAEAESEASEEETAPEEE
jgi:hypothetical protein